MDERCAKKAKKNIKYRTLGEKEIEKAGKADNFLMSRH